MSDVDQDMKRLRSEIARFIAEAIADDKTGEIRDAARELLRDNVPRPSQPVNLSALDGRLQAIDFALTKQQETARQTLEWAKTTSDNVLQLAQAEGHAGLVRQPNIGPGKVGAPIRPTIGMEEVDPKPLFPKILVWLGIGLLFIMAVVAVILILSSSRQPDASSSSGRDADPTPSIEPPEQEEAIFKAYAQLLLDAGKREETKLLCGIEILSSDVPTDCTFARRTKTLLKDAAGQKVVSFVLLSSRVCSPPENFGQVSPAAGFDDLKLGDDDISAAFERCLIKFEP